MSSVLFRIATATVHNAKKVLAAWIAFLVVVVVAMFALGGKLTNDFQIPGTEGQEGLDIMAERFPEMSGTAGQVVFGAPEGESIWDYQDKITPILKQAESIPMPLQLLIHLMTPSEAAGIRQRTVRIADQFSFGLDSLMMTP